MEKSIEVQDLLSQWNSLPNSLFEIVSIVVFLLVLIVFCVFLTSNISVRFKKHIIIFSFLIGLVFIGNAILNENEYKKQLSEVEKNTELYVNQLPTKISYKIQDYDLNSKNVNITIQENKPTNVLVEIKEKDYSSTLVVFENAKFIEDPETKKIYMKYKKLDFNLGNKYRKGKVKVEFHIPKK